MYCERILWAHMATAEVEYVVLAVFALCPNSLAMQDLCASDKMNCVGLEHTR